jgi:hypothetical protein
MRMTATEQASNVATRGKSAKDKTCKQTKNRSERKKVKVKDPHERETTNYGDQKKLYSFSKSICLAPDILISGIIQKWFW